MTSSTMRFFDGRITIDPVICNGKPTIRGKRIAVQTVLEFLGAGESETEILNQSPALKRGISRLARALYCAVLIEWVFELFERGML
jgi:uncharacterized protein (DUF433 family)